VGQFVGPRQVEFALSEPPCSQILELGGVDRCAVDLDQSTTHHRLENRFRVDRGGKQLARIVDLIGQYVDQKLVGRIRRQARAPVLHSDRRARP